VTYVTTE